jgi:hypothetical protein
MFITTQYYITFVGAYSEINCGMRPANESTSAQTTQNSGTSGPPQDVYAVAMLDHLANSQKQQQFGTPNQQVFMPGSSGSSVGLGQANI